MRSSLRSRLRRKTRRQRRSRRRPIRPRSRPRRRERMLSQFRRPPPQLPLTLNLLVAKSRCSLFSSRGMAVSLAKTTPLTRETGLELKSHSQYDSYPALNDGCQVLFRLMSHQIFCYSKRLCTLYNSSCAIFIPTNSNLMTSSRLCTLIFECQISINISR